MDSKKRHELETNDLREFLDNFKDFWDKNGNSILITLIVVVGGWTAWNFYKNKKVEKNDNAVMALAEATNGEYLLSVAEDHPSVAHIALQRAGDDFLDRACVAAIAGTDSEVPDLLQKASDAYQRVADKDSNPIEFRINAMLGLATAAEMNGEWDKAKSYYDSAQEIAGERFVHLAQLAEVGRDGLDDLRHPIAFGPEIVDNPGLPANPNDLTGDGLPDLPPNIPPNDPLFPNDPVTPGGDPAAPDGGIEIDPLLQPGGTGGDSGGE